MEKLKKQKGITLIALIITIIVMLILVGVTINVALNGGLFQKAEYASEQMQIKADEEELQIEIATAYNEKEGIVNFETLAINLRAKGWDVTDSGDKLICTSPKGNTFTVTAEGKTSEGGIHTGGSDSVPGTEGTTLISMYRSGENCKEENCTNEEHLHVGDYMNYMPDTTITTYYPDGENEENAGQNTGYTTNLQEVTQESLTWRVLGASGNNVLLISGTPTATRTGAIQFNGYVGYNNYETILNTACTTLYSKSGIGTAKSITMSDIDEYLDGKNYDKKTYSTGQDMESYGYTNESINSKFDYNASTNTLTKLDEGTTTLSLTSKAYIYDASAFIKDKVKLELLKGSNGNYYYLIASRAIKVGSPRAFFGYDMLYAGYICGGTFSFCDSEGTSQNVALSLRPVVTLEENVTIEKVGKVTETIEENWTNPF